MSLRLSAGKRWWCGLVGASGDGDESETERRERRGSLLNAVNCLV